MPPRAARDPARSSCTKRTSRERARFSNNSSRSREGLTKHRRTPRGRAALRQTLLILRNPVEQSPVGREGGLGQVDEPLVLHAVERGACLGGVLVVALAVDGEVLDRGRA